MMEKPGRTLRKTEECMGGKGKSSENLIKRNIEYHEQ